MRIRFLKIPRRIAKVATRFRPGIAYGLLLAIGIQSAAPAWAWEPTHPSPAPVAAPPGSFALSAAPSSLASPIPFPFPDFHPPATPASVSPPPAALDLDGPTVAEFRAAFPNRAGRAVQKVDPVTFSRFAGSHFGQGRLLTGAALSAAVAAAAGAPVVKTAPVKTGAARPAKPKTGRAGARVGLDYGRIAAACDSLLLEARPACRDSLKKKALAKSLLAQGEYSGLDVREAESNGRSAMNAEAMRLRCDTMPAEYRPRCRDSVAYLDTVFPLTAKIRYVKARASLRRVDKGPNRAELEALELPETSSGSAVKPPRPKPKFDPYRRCADVPLKQGKKCLDSLNEVVRRKSDSIRVANHLRPGDSLRIGEILAEELDPPYRPPVPPPFSFKDSIPDLDTAYSWPSSSAAEDEMRLEHRQLVRRYKAHRDSVRRDSLDAIAVSNPTPRDSGAIGEMQERGPSVFRADDDTLILGYKPERDDRADHTRVDEDLDEDGKHHNWFVNIFADAREGGGGGGGWDGDDWAAVIYVVIGVVVVGAFVIYGLQMLGEMALNQEGYPLFMEAGVRLSYSGKAIEDQQGVGRLYRDAYLAGLRFAIGFDRPGMGIGLAAEGGYIDIFLRSTSDPARTFDFKGGYLVAGPLIRFGDNDPWSFSLEFLNGTSTHEAIGWISKSRMTLQAKVTEHMLVGGHLGAVFYDLHFFDGLGLREGNFNRDLSLVWGLDTGWEF